MNELTLKNSGEVAVICEGIRCLRDIAENYELQKTQRYEIREKCRLATKVIDANTELIKYAIDNNREERLKLLNMLEIILLKPQIDNAVLILAERIFANLENSSPAVVLKNSLQVPMLW